VTGNKFSPDGKFLMVTLLNYGIEYYNVTTNYTRLGTITSGFSSLENYCMAIYFTPNGSNFLYNVHQSPALNTLMLNMPALNSNR